MRKWINGRLINGNRIDLEVCYYPEHWDRSLWAEMRRPSPLMLTVIMRELPH